ncbi:MAG: hypothetical protein JW984_04750 [Deltaproteobacteria bacterium]|uniref:DUF4410 domain-containing protein n=1 Tax=Candidatus Zymogenus saltonus TaxID=2844893 RepID=A0A9D8KEA2_9DELT|nr:hypothetical protein [Candidatus Zymogenus saltonus]
MKTRDFRLIAFLFSLLLIVSLLILPAYAKKDVLTEDSEFRDPDEVWDFIPDYTGMVEGDSADWIWMKPGLDLSRYKTVVVPLFENRSKMIDIHTQEMLTDNMRQSMTRFGMSVVDEGGEITVFGCMVDYSGGSGSAEFWIGYGAGNPFVEVEVYIVDNSTGEIVTKVRHQAMDNTIPSAAAEVIHDIITDWSRR